MAFQLKQLVPCLCIVLLFLSITSFSHAKAKRCKCHDSYQDQRSNRTFGDGFLYNLIGKDPDGVLTVGQDFLRNLTDSEASNTDVLCFFPENMPLWLSSYYVTNQQPPVLVVYDEASFSATIVYQPLRNQSRSGLAFLVLPSVTFKGYNEELVLFGPFDLANSTFGSADLHGTTSVSVSIGAISSNRWSHSDDGHPMVVNITVDPSPVAAGASNYAVWIDCDPLARRLSVYVDLEGQPKPENTIAEFHQSIRTVVSQDVRFALLSTAAQLLRVGDHGWNVTVTDFAYHFVPIKRSFLPIILSSVLGFLAVSVALAAVVGYCFNSRYWRWHEKEMNQLVKSMERLPGVPRKIHFTDIKKATNNFDEHMKIGGGTFGTVYRCKLRAAASRSGQPMDVAVKKFTRCGVKNSSYDDFLAEVSIVNRLRHKNIVPLVGWAYDKGVPLLVFEFMNNGSLEQHLFPRGGSCTRQRGADEAIQQWATRYEIVRGIATGLHYVHHEYEPMVLHCDIKASNVMLDSSFRARLGDFGLACIVTADRNSATVMGGTLGYMSPEYTLCGKATRQTDVYALGVLILEIVTSQRALVANQGNDVDHITDRVWRLHREGRLPECVDATVLAAVQEDERLDAGRDAERLLLLGLACSSPNPSDRPTMPEVVQVIAKSAPPPEVPLEKPRFVWPPPEEGRSMASDDDNPGMPIMSYLDGTPGEAQVHISFVHPAAAMQARTTRRHASFQSGDSVYVTATSALVPEEIPTRP